MIWGIGSDLCQIDRIAKMTEQSPLNPHILTPREWTRLEGLCPERRAERAAGIFAAKEAIAKALGTGFSGFSFPDIEIWADAQGKPCATLHGAAAKRLPPDAAIHLSISHDGGMALAFAVIEAPERSEVTQ